MTPRADLLKSDPRLCMDPKELNAGPVLLSGASVQSPVKIEMFKIELGTPAHFRVAQFLLYPHSPLMEEQP